MHLLKEKLADFYALPRWIGTARCDWCGDEITDEHNTHVLYWAYRSWFIVPERAQLCSDECTQRAIDRIGEGEVRPSSAWD